MNKFLSKITSEWALRAGLGIMYVYSGVDMILHPTSWFWAVRSLTKILPVDTGVKIFTNLGVINNYLVFQGLVELVLAIVLLGWFMPKQVVKFVAILSVLKFIIVLVLIPVDAVTFEGIGLVGAFLALWIILSQQESSKRGEYDSGGKTSQPTQVSGPTVETFDHFMGAQSK